MKIIAIDVMSGDHGAPVTVPAVLSLLEKFPEVNFLLVGSQEVIRKELARLNYASYRSRLEVVGATEVVAMDESPSQALRSKKDSSMRVAINLVHEGRADACVSAGNTGALMAISKFVLKTVTGISRPAILTRFPTLQPGQITRVLDLGANVDVSADQLVQFAVMGSVLAEAVGGIDSPRVGLLNVGEEDIKGNALVKDAHNELLALSDINYVGYIEGNAWFSGEVEVAVCDGFVGNIALKAVEGVTDLMAKYIVGGFEKNLYSKLSGLLAKPVLKNVKQQFDPRSYNGATFIGLNGVIIKSHGSADELAFAVAIKEAVLEIDKNVPQLIGSKVAQTLSMREKE